MRHANILPCSKRHFFKGKCAVVTSYNPLTRDVTKEETGANTETDKQFIYNTYTELLKEIEAKSAMTKTEAYEEWAKDLFTKQPANMRLLVVVDKLLTGFDAPRLAPTSILTNPCRTMAFSRPSAVPTGWTAMTRISAISWTIKTFLKKWKMPSRSYTSELDNSAGGTAPEVLLQDRLKKAGSASTMLWRPLPCFASRWSRPGVNWNISIIFAVTRKSRQICRKGNRSGPALYKGTVAMVRAYANIADDLEPAGYNATDIARITQQRDHYLKVREIIRKASDENLDLKAYEADMRHLIDTYIEADEPRTISPFDNMSLLELIVKTGIAKAISQQLGGLKG